MTYARRFEVPPPTSIYMGAMPEHAFMMALLEYGFDRDPGADGPFANIVQHINVPDELREATFDHAVPMLNAPGQHIPDWDKDLVPARYIIKGSLVAGPRRLPMTVRTSRYPVPKAVRVAKGIFRLGEPNVRLTADVEYPRPGQWVGIASDQQ